MPLLIRNGLVVTAEGRRRADIYAEGETITRIGADLTAPPDAEVIDAAGRFVFPGFIDPHVHIYLPLGDVAARDTHETGSIAALTGGTTTYLEMICPTRGEDTLEGYHRWAERAAGASACDYSFHISVCRNDPRTEAQLREIVAGGIPSFKIYLAYKASSGITDRELFRTLALARRLGAVTVGHCENADVIECLQEQFVGEGKRGPEWHEPSRPEAVEAEGTERFTSFLELTGAAGCVAHLSCRPALARALAARARGVDVAIECVVAHLLLDKTYAERPGLDGMRYILSPPLRDRANQPALWEALAAGAIDTVATDHCPFDLAQKALGADAFPRIPNGLPGIEDRVRLLYTYGVQRGRLTLERMVEAASTRPARLFGLHPRKGDIAPGADADLVVYDPAWRGSLCAATQHVNCDYNPFEGVEVEGRAAAVTVRGRVQVRDGRFVGEKGRGHLLRRQPFTSCLQEKRNP